MNEAPFIYNVNNFNLLIVCHLVCLAEQFFSGAVEIFFYFLFYYRPVVYAYMTDYHIVDEIEPFTPILDVRDLIVIGLIIIIIVWICYGLWRPYP